MGLVEATFVGMVLLAVMAVLGALLVSVAMGALESTVGAKPSSVATKPALHTARAVTWRVVGAGDALCLTDGRVYIAMRGELIAVRRAS